MRELRRWVGVVRAAAFALGFLAFAGAARAEVGLCVEAKSDRGDQVAFEKLLRSELGRHPSHRPTQGACESHLAAELFHLGGTRYLTLRIDTEIPVRYAVRNDAELEARLADGLTRVLGNDPAYIARNPSELAGPERAVRSILVRGNNSYRLAFLETMVRTDTGVAFAPGVAFELARGADHFAVFARTSFSGSPTKVQGSERVLRMLGQVDAGVTYEASARAATSAYAGLGVGLGLLQFEGRQDAADPTSTESVIAVGATLQARAGVRFLRLYDFDCEAFLLGVLPAFATKNADGLLFGESGIYTPFVQLGLGIGF